MDEIEIVDGVPLLNDRLRAAHIPHAFGGAIAYGRYGIPRGTNDWDVNIFLPETAAEAVFDALRPLAIEPTAEQRAELSKSGQVRLDWGGKKLDLFFAYAEFHKSAEARVRESDFEGESIFVLSAEDIIVFKILFDRAHDWRDIERIFHRMGDRIELDYVNHWLTAMLGAEDSRIQHLAGVVEKARELMAEGTDSES